MSTDGGIFARWSRDGRELFYQHPDRLMAVPILPGMSFSFGKPTVLFEAKGSRHHRRWDTTWRPTASAS